MLRNWLVGLWRSLSVSGFVLGTAFFAVSLTPTLLPRTFPVQGVLSGSALAVGLGISVFGRWLWTYMKLPKPPCRALQIIKYVMAAICTNVAAVSLWQAPQWQNSIRKLMGLEPVGSAYSIQVGLIALATSIVLIVLARLFRMALGCMSARVDRFVPRRISNVVGFVAAVALFWSVINGAFVRVALHAANASYKELDALFEPESGHAILIPGQFVTVVVRPTEAQRRPVVPLGAVQLDREGRFVLLLDQDKKVAQRRIRTGNQLGQNWIVEEGLSGGENLIVQGAQNARPGGVVRVIPSPSAPQRGG